MCQRSIQISSLVGYLYPVFLVSRILDLAHYIHTVGYHNQDHTHIFGKGEQKVTEILRLYCRALRIQFIRFHQSLDDTCHILSVFHAYLVDRQNMRFYNLVQHDTDKARTFHSDFFGYDDCRLQIFDNGIHPEVIALQPIILGSFDKMIL